MPLIYARSNFGYRSPFCKWQLASGSCATLLPFDDDDHRLRFPTIPITYSMLFLTPRLKLVTFRDFQLQLWLMNITDRHVMRNLTYVRRKVLWLCSRTCARNMPRRCLGHSPDDLRGTLRNCRDVEYNFLLANIKQLHDSSPLQSQSQQ